MFRTTYSGTGASFEGGWGAVAPPKEKEKRKKERKKEKKEKRKKGEKKEERKKGTMNNFKLLHIKCCFFQFFDSLVASKNIKKIAPQEKVEMTPLFRHSPDDSPASYSTQVPSPSLNTVELLVIHNRPCKHSSKLQLSI